MLWFVPWRASSRTLNCAKWSNLTSSHNLPPAEANKGRRKIRGTPPRPRQEASPPAPLSGALTAPFLRRGTQDWFQGRIERAIGFIPSGIDLLDLWTWLCMLHETYHGVTCLLY